MQKIKVKIAAIFLLLSKTLTLLAGCAAPTQDKDINNSTDNTSLSTQFLDEAPEVDSEIVNPRTEDEIGASYFPYKTGQTLTTQKVEKIIDVDTNEKILEVSYLQDNETKELYLIEVKSSEQTLYIIYSDEDIEHYSYIKGTDPKEDIENYVIPLLNGYTYITDVYEFGNIFKSYTLFPESDDYDYVKCVYQYTSSKTLEKTLYYDKNGALLFDIGFEVEDGIEWTIARYYDKQTGEEVKKEYVLDGQLKKYLKRGCNGCSYKVEYNDDGTVDYIFYNSKGEEASTVTVYELSESVIVDEDGILKVVASIPGEKAIYTINEEGQIVYTYIKKYDVENKEIKIISEYVSKLDKRECIFDKDNKDDSIITIDYFVESFKNANEQVYYRPARVLISSKYLKEPLLIECSYNEEGMIVARDNQMLTDNPDDAQMFVDIDDEIKYYIKKIKRKYEKKENIENPSYMTSSCVFKYTETGEIKECNRLDGKKLAQKTTYGEHTVVSKYGSYIDDMPVSIIHYIDDALWYEEWNTHEVNGCMSTETIWINTKVDKTNTALVPPYAYEFEFKNKEGMIGAEIYIGNEDDFDFYNRLPYLILSVARKNGYEEIYEIDSNGACIRYTSVGQIDTNIVVTMHDYTTSKTYIRKYPINTIEYEEALPYSDSYNEEWTKKSDLLQNSDLTYHSRSYTLLLRKLNKRCTHN